MGFVRVLLVIAVVFEHSFGTAFSGGLFAVQLFFVMSGFVISYILVEARAYDSLTSYYVNRVLRLFPVYWAVAILSLAMYLGGAYLFGNPPPFLEVYMELDAPGLAVLALANVFLIGQDWVIFLAAQDGALVFTPDYHMEDIWVWQGLLVPPAWSLSVELTFYAIAPFILARFRLLILLLILSIALRLYLISLGLGSQDPWNYRFFPTELALFLLGALSHQVLRPLYASHGLMSERRTLWITFGVALVSLLCVTLHVLPLRLSVLALFVLSLPFLFQYQHHRPWDRWLGRWSYPVYIVHWTVMFPVSYVWDRMTGIPGYQGLDETCVILLLSFVGGYVLKRFVSDPVEELRDKVRTSRQSARLRQVE